MIFHDFDEKSGAKDHRGDCPLDSPHILNKVICVKAASRLKTGEHGVVFLNLERHVLDGLPAVLQVAVQSPNISQQSIHSNINTARFLILAQPVCSMYIPCLSVIPCKNAF